MPIPAATGRYFVGLPLPVETRSILKEFAPAGQGIRRVPQAKLHLTLHFLGEMDQPAVQAAAAALRDISSSAFSLTIAAGGQFPPRGKARVLWAGIAENDALSLLQTECGQLLQAAIGFVPEQRPYCPHVTLARCGSGVDKTVINQFHRSTADLKIPNISVDTVVLFCSRLHSAGPNYEVIETINLATG